jgi:hypothetical protein
MSLAESPQRPHARAVRIDGGTAFQFRTVRPRPPRSFDGDAERGSIKRPLYSIFGDMNQRGSLAPEITKTHPNG